MGEGHDPARTGGIIGLGYWDAAVCDTDPQRLEAAARDFGGRPYADAAELFASEDLDFVDIATTPPTHPMMVHLAAEHGVAAICQKPLAWDLEDARAMVAAMEAKGLPFMVHENFRFQHPMRRVKEVLDSGAIGRLTAIDAEFSAPIAMTPGEFRYSPALGGGAMRDLGCYALSWCLSLDDTPIAALAVDAVLTQGGVDESVTARLDFASGVTARVRTSMAAGQAIVRHLRVEGSKGTITFDNPLAPHTGSRIIREGAPDLVFGEASGATYFHQLAAIAQAITTGAPLPTEGAAILRQQAALDHICAQFGQEGQHL